MRPVTLYSSEWRDFIIGLVALLITLMFWSILLIPVAI